LRRNCLAAWRFLLPALGGLIGGYFFAGFLVHFGMPPWVMMVFPFMMAMGTGAGGKEWLDKNLGPPRDRRP
jgi:hypothetical protein